MTEYRKPAPRNGEAFARWVAAREADGGRSFARFVKADRQYLVDTGRAGDFAVEVVSDEDLAHDTLLATRCQFAAKAARHEDGHRYLNSRLGVAS
jgi:hypothetical protein